MQVIDADGHVNDRPCMDEISKYMPSGNRTQVFPAFDHIHFLEGGEKRSRTATVGPQEWVNFLDETGIDWTVVRFDLEQFRMGLDVELEHGRRDPATDVTGDDPVVTGKLALAHLNELPDYYTRLAAMEEPTAETPASTARRIARSLEWT